MKMTLNSKYKNYGTCKMCGNSKNTIWFSSYSWLTEDTIDKVCRDCAYRESFGSKYISKAKKENLLELSEDT